MLWDYRHLHGVLVGPQECILGSGCFVILPLDRSFPLTQVGVIHPSLVMHEPPVEVQIITQGVIEVDLT